MRGGAFVERELHEFWRLLDATRDEVITAGKRPFNPRLFLRALQIIYDNYFGNDWADPRALLFWQKVVGYDGIQRVMPVNYVQAFHDWLPNTVRKLKHNQPQDRSTRFEIFRVLGGWVDVDFYPLQARGSLGFNFAIYGAGYLWRGIVERAVVGSCAGGTVGLADDGDHFEAYISQKNCRLFRSCATTA